MSLTAGSHLGPYEVIAKLGEGGMGEVYRARDNKLHRDVALKILPETLTVDPDRLARFHREAQVLASLNHPNIAAIYGFEDSGAIHALVMELIEGEDLSEMIGPERGAERAEGLPLPDAIAIARQIADALEAAHEHGIVHRDLKPANIKVRPDGTVKVLDFGLAKALDPEGTSSGAIQNSPTMTARATAMGMILGTAAYMAPEQARGKVVDKRADIWAFGVVLYEMLTGARAFKGEEISDTLAAVLKDTPDFGALPASVPARLRALIGRCLERDVKLRLRDIGEARVELARIAEGRAEPAAPAAVPAAPSRPSMLPWAVAVVALAIAGYAGWRAWGGRPSPVSAPAWHARLTLEPAEALLGSNPTEIRVGSRRPSRPAITLSADGRWLAFLGEQAGTQQMFLRDLRRDAAVAVAGTTGADSLFFSPDSKWIGFWSNGALRKVPVDGGPAVEICKTGRINGADWGADGRIAFGGSDAIDWVSADGGQPAPLTKLDPATHETAHWLPRWLPGDRILYTAVLRRSPVGRRVVVQRTDGSGRQVLAENATDGRVVADGRYLIFLRGSTLMAARFDVSRGAVVGGTVGVIDGVLVSLNAPNSGIDQGAGQFAVNDAGAIVYVPGGMFEDTRATLTWMDRQARLQPVDMDKRPYLAARFSPDGQRVVMSTTGAERAVWVYDLGRRSLMKLPFDGDVDWPVWTPDGKALVFAGTTNEGSALYQVAADGSGKAELLPGSDRLTAPADWSHDGRELICDGFIDGRRTLVAFSPADKSMRALVQSRGFVSYASVSPDGRWLAYATDNSGRLEVFVQPYAGGTRVQVSTNGGEAPRWTRDGRELIFKQTLDVTKSAYWSVPVLAGTGFTMGPPHRIGEASGTDFGSAQPRSNFDIAPDGRLLGTTRNYTTPPPPKILNLITNWFEELAAKLK